MHIPKLSPIQQGAIETYAEKSWETSIPAVDIADFDTTSMCAVTMSMLKGIAYGDRPLNLQPTHQVFLFGASDGWSYNRWFTVDPQQGIYEMPYTLPFEFDRGLCHSGSPNQGNDFA